MDLGRRMHAYSLLSAWLLCSNAVFYWEAFEKGCEQWYSFLLCGVAEAVHFSNLPRPPASGCWPFFSTFAYKRSLPELISFWECLAKSCEKQPVPAPRAAGFLGREASKYSDLKTTVYFSLLLTVLRWVVWVWRASFILFFHYPPGQCFSNSLCFKTGFFLLPVCRRQILLVYTPQITHLYFTAVSNCRKHF